MKKRHPDSEMVGKVFGRLTVIKRIGTKGKHSIGKILTEIIAQKTADG